MCRKYVERPAFDLALYIGTDLTDVQVFSIVLGLLALVKRNRLQLVGQFARCPEPRDGYESNRNNDESQENSKYEITNWGHLSRLEAGRTRDGVLSRSDKR